MSETDVSRTTRHAIVITVGVVLFLYFILLCYQRELGPAKIFKPLFVFGFLLGLGAGLLGAIDIMLHPPTDRGIGIALIVEGAVMIVLTLIAWTAMGWVPLSTDELLAAISGGLHAAGSWIC